MLVGGVREVKLAILAAKPVSALAFDTVLKFLIFNQFKRRFFSAICQNKSVNTGLGEILVLRLRESRLLTPYGTGGGQVHAT